MLNVESFLIMNYFNSAYTLQLLGHKRDGISVAQTKFSQQ